MTIKKHLATLGAIAIISGACVLAAQTAVDTAGTGGGHYHHGMRRMAAKLGLSDTQKTQARTIFQAAAQQAKPIRQDLQTQRQAVRAAIEAGNAAQAQQLAAKEGADMGQLASIRAGAFASFYSSLTPQQQQQLQAMEQARQARSGVQNSTTQNQ